MAGDEVDQVEQRFARMISTHIFNQNLRRQIRLLNSVTGDMWGGNLLGHGTKWAGRRQRLLRNDIQTGAS